MTETLSLHFYGKEVNLTRAVFKIAGRNTSNRRHADDTTLRAESEEKSESQETFLRSHD